MSIKRTIITTILALALVATVAPAAAQADTLSSLMAQISALQAQIASLQGGANAGTGLCAGVTFTRTLAVGSTGSDVKCLQQMLSVKPTSGYFGPVTLAAVREYQESKGFVPANQVGPQTRQALNASLSAVTPAGNFPAGCTSTAGFSTTTGLSCSSPVGNFPAGCASATGFSSTTGVSCSTGTGTVGGTGFLTTPELSASPASNANIIATSNVPVLGVDVRATGSDITVNSAEVELTVIKNAASQEFPAIAVQNLYVYDGSTLLGTYPVNTSTVLTGSNSTEYYMILSGFRFVAPVNTTKSLTITADFTPGLETNRVLTINLFDQGLRGVDGSGAYTTASALVNAATVSGATVTNSTSNYRQQTVTYTTVGSSTLTVSIDPSTPASTDVAINHTSGTTDVPVSVLDAKSTTGASKITSVVLTVQGTLPATGKVNALKLYDGSILLGSQSLSSAASGATATFSNLSIPVAQDATKALTVKVDVAAGTNAINATTLKVNLASSAITYQTPALSSTTATGTAAGNYMYFYDGGATAIGLVSTSIAYTPNSTTSGSGLATGVLTFSFKANGGTTTEPVVGDFTVQSCTVAGSCTTPSTAIQVTPNNSTSGIADQGTATVAISGSFQKLALASGYYYFKVTAINWAMTGVTGTLSTSSGTDNDASAITNWQTSPVYVY